MKYFTLPIGDILKYTGRLESLFTVSSFYNKHKLTDICMENSIILGVYIYVFIRWVGWG